MKILFNLENNIVIRVSYLLLDAARMEVNLEKAQALESSHSSLYEGKTREDIAGVGPFLFPCINKSDLFQFFTQEGLGQSWGVLFYSHLPFVELYRHCRKFLLIRTEDNQELYFRFYDPRVLRIFLPTCSKEQLREFFGPIQYFLVEDEDIGFVLRYWLENYTLKVARISREDFISETDLNELPKTQIKKIDSSTDIPLDIRNKSEKEIPIQQVKKDKKPPSPNKGATKWGDFFFD